MPNSTNSSEVSPLSVALSAAREAGDVLRRQWPRTRQVTYKGLRDIVTDADYAAQAVILEELRSAYPEHAILSEEGQHDIDLSSQRPTWIVDPLDGTTNYSRRFPNFSVCVALAVAGKVQTGVVYDPLRRETFYGERGRGAFVQRGRGRPQALRVSGVDDPAEALVGVDWARDPAKRAETLAALERVAARCRTVRATGSAALGLAYVAAGWLDAYYHYMLQPWDIAAAAVIIDEAGGRLSTPAGEPWRLGMGAVAASNGRLAEVFVRLLSGEESAGP
jgi:myo-inositol-1(or 4)-monophosphatase